MKRLETLPASPVGGTAAAGMKRAETLPASLVGGAAAPGMKRLLIAAAVWGCGDNRSDDEPTVLVDRNPDPTIVEVDLVAEQSTAELLPGTLADVWAFRDAAGRASVPGPLLEANLGDRVIVHFENRLPEPTTIHWHGLRVPNAADGTPVSQLMIEPGGRYDYEFTAIDAGLYWYHPHMAGDVQVERGLHAPIRIRGGVEPDVAADRVFVLDDVKLEATGQLSQTTDNLDMMLGRQGNVVLVDGRPDRTLEVAAGTRERWRFVNVANGRYFNLDLPGHSFLVIGSDGGVLPTPYQAETLLIAPGERYEVLVEPTSETALRTVFYDRGHNIPNPGPIELMQIRLGPSGAAPGPLPEFWADVPAIPVDATTPRLTFDLRELDGPPPTFSINNEAYPDVTPIAAVTDDVAIWDIVNKTEMDHPFHLHGMSFQVIDERSETTGGGNPTGSAGRAGGSAPRGIDDLRLGRKDTVNVPRMATRRLAVRYGSEGRWMFHCHILEHAERGMMGELVVTSR